MIRNMVNKVMNKGKFKWLAESNNRGKTFMERLANLNCTKVSVVCDFFFSAYVVVLFLTCIFCNLVKNYKVRRTILVQFYR